MSEGPQAVILAGGLGTRMRPLTETIPKPMLSVAGKPFLEHQLNLLKHHGVRRVLLLVAYLGETIERYFGDGSQFHCQLDYSYEPAPLGTGGGLKLAEKKLSEEFILLNGDTYLAVAYDRLMAEFSAGRDSALIVAYQRPLGAPAITPADRVPNNLGVLPEGCVTCYRKRNAEGLTHVDAGAIALRKEILGPLPEGKAFSLEEEVYPQLIREGRMRAWRTAEPFYDMGSPEGLAALEEKLK
jgi:NDP-sugar pyrophosphorylase family protein